MSGTARSSRLRISTLTAGDIIGGSMTTATEFLDGFGEWADSARIRRAAKLTPAVRLRLVEGVLKGLGHAQAARLAGISPQTFERWIAKGEEAMSGAERELVLLIQAAEAQLEKELVDVMRTAATEAKDWRAAEALLKRRFPDRWGDRGRVDVRVFFDSIRRLQREYPEFTEDEIVAEAEAVLRAARLA